MVPAATLKVFQPLTAFDETERRYWQRYVRAGAEPPSDTIVLSRELGLAGPTATLVSKSEHADVIERNGAKLVCPHRTKLRLLASVLAFRRSIPADAVGAFMPPGEIERAAQKIDEIRSAHPGWRNHILESTWRVPLHWFVAFDDDERTFVSDGDISSIIYETRLRDATRRCAHALEVVRDALPNPAVIAPVAGLARWLDDFDDASALILDYGGVGGLLRSEDLRADRTCRQIWSSIEALEQGDLDRATAYYMVASERWSGFNRRESWN